jgi:hypothetical protein
MNPEETAPIYVLSYEDGSPVEGQSNIVDTIPGLSDYSAFWRVHVVTVPDDYVANSVRSLAGIQAAGFPIEATDILVNCPIIGSPTDVSLTGLTGESGSVAVIPALKLFVCAGLAIAVFAIRRRSSALQEA